MQFIYLSFHLSDLLGLTLKVTLKGMQLYIYVIPSLKGQYEQRKFTKEHTFCFFGWGGVEVEKERKKRKKSISKTMLRGGGESGNSLRGTPLLNIRNSFSLLFRPHLPCAFLPQCQIWAMSPRMTTIPSNVHILKPR